MFDPVTEVALRLRRRAAPPAVSQPPPSRNLLVCSVCHREIVPEETVHWAAGEVHCSQCHSMLEYELSKERQADREAREGSKRWKDDA